jgi:hypothetical protein
VTSDCGPRRLVLPLGFALVAVLLTAVLGASAAVLPLSDEPHAGMGAPRRLLVGDSTLPAMAGVWTGKTATGQLVSITLTSGRGSVTGLANLGGIVATERGAPLPILASRLSGRSLSFVVRPGGCEKSQTQAVLTLVTSGAAQLDLIADHKPVRVKLTKIG